MLKDGVPVVEEREEQENRIEHAPRYIHVYDYLSNTADHAQTNFLLHSNNSSHQICQKNCNYRLVSVRVLVQEAEQPLLRVVLRVANRTIIVLFLLLLLLLRVAD